MDETDQPKALFFIRVNPFLGAMVQFLALVLRLEELRQRARFVEVRAANVGKIPAWHPSAGAKAWLFAEELLVNPLETP